MIRYTDAEAWCALLQMDGVLHRHDSGDWCCRVALRSPNGTQKFLIEIHTDPNAAVTLVHCQWLKRDGLSAGPAAQQRDRTTD